MLAKYLTICVFTLSLAHPTSTLAASWQGRVSHVTDGDTLTVLNGQQPVVVRIAEIDAPEDGQAWGRQSRQALGDLLADQMVTVDERARDHYGRTVARIRVGSIDAGEELVRHGHAWHFTRYSNDAHLAELQDEARAAKVGLWSQPDPIAPWDYRSPNSPQVVVQQLIPSRADATEVAASGFSCGGKRYCKQMSSCEEAYFYLTRCGLHRLDGDSDGVPCETIC